MRTVPHIMKGAFRLANALAENVALPSTSWRACSKEAFEGEGALFPGRPVVAIVGTESGERSSRSPSSTRRRRRPTNSVAMREERAKTLVKLGELPAARVALEGAPFPSACRLCWQRWDPSCHRGKSLTVCEGDRGGRHHEEVGSKNHGKLPRWRKLQPVPARPDHKSRLRVCCPHSANHHGQG